MPAEGASKRVNNESPSHCNSLLPGIPNVEPVLGARWDLLVGCDGY
jgi:hypothetical protein